MDETAKRNLPVTAMKVPRKFSAMGPQANIAASKDTPSTQTDVVFDKIINDCLTEIKSSAEFEDLIYRLHRSCTGEMCLIITGGSAFGVLGPPLDPINVTVAASGLCYTYVQFLPVEVTDLKTDGCLNAKKFQQVLRKLTGKSRTFCPGFVKTAFPDDFDYEAHGLQLLTNPFFRVQSLRCEVFYETCQATPRVITPHLDLQLCPSCQRVTSEHCLAEKMKSGDPSMIIFAKLYPAQDKHEALTFSHTAQTSGTQEPDQLETNFQAEEENSQDISWTTGFENQSSEEKLSDSLKNRELSEKLTRDIAPERNLTRQPGCKLLASLKECSVRLNRLEAGDRLRFFKHKNHKFNSGLLGFHSLPASPISLRVENMDEVSAASTETFSLNPAPLLSPRPVLSARVKPFTINSCSTSDSSRTLCFNSAKSRVVPFTPVSLTTDGYNTSLSPEAEPPILMREVDLSQGSPYVPRPLNNNFDSDPVSKRQCYRCPSCLEAFSSSPDVKQPVQCHRCSTVLRDDSKSNGAVCTEVPACKALATKRLTSVPAATQPKLLSVAQRRKVMNCTDCRRQFRKKTLFARHIKKHMERAQYFCTVCSKLFSRQKSYANHMARHRTYHRVRPSLALAGRDKFMHSKRSRAEQCLGEEALPTAISMPMHDSCASGALLAKEASTPRMPNLSEENTKLIVPVSGWSMPLSCSAKKAQLSHSAATLNPDTAIISAGATSIHTDGWQSETSSSPLSVTTAAIDLHVTVPCTFPSSTQSLSAQVLSTGISSAPSAETLASESNLVTAEASSTQLLSEGRSPPAAHPLSSGNKAEEPGFPFTDCDLNLHLLSSVSLAKAELDGPIVLRVPDKTSPATACRGDGETLPDDVSPGPSLEVAEQSFQHSAADGSSSLIALPSSSGPELPQSKTNHSLADRVSDTEMAQSEVEKTLKEREERVHKMEEVLKARELAMTKKDLFLQKLMLAYIARQHKTAAPAGNCNSGNKSSREDNNGQSSNTAAPCTLGSVADVPSKAGVPNEQKLLALYAAFNTVMRRVSGPRPSASGSSSVLGHPFPTGESDKSFSHASKHPLLRDSISSQPIQPKLPAAPAHGAGLGAGPVLSMPRLPLDSVVKTQTACPTQTLTGSSTVAHTKPETATLPSAGNSQSLQASSSIRRSLMMLQQIKQMESLLPDKAKEYLPQSLPAGCESRNTPVSSLQDNYSLCPSSPGPLSSYPGSPLQNSPLSTNSSLTSLSHPNSPLFYAPASQECSLKASSKSVIDKGKSSDVSKKGARETQARKKAGKTQIIQKKESGLAGCFVEEAHNPAVTPIITASQMKCLLSLIKPASPVEGQPPTAGTEQLALSSETENSTISSPLPSLSASAEHGSGSAAAKDSLPPSPAGTERHLSLASPTAVNNVRTTVINLLPAVNSSRSPACTEVESLCPASFRRNDPDVVAPTVAVYKEIPFQADSCSPMSASDFGPASQSESHIVSYKAVNTVKSPSPSRAAESHSTVPFTQPVSMREPQVKDKQTWDMSPSKLDSEMSHSDARLSVLNSNSYVSNTWPHPVAGQPQPITTLPQTQAYETLAGLRHSVTQGARLAKPPAPSPSNMPPLIRSAPYNLSAALSRGRYPHLSPPAAATRASPPHVAPPGAFHGPNTLSRGSYPHLSPPAATTRVSPSHVALQGAHQGTERSVRPTLTAPPRYGLSWHPDRQAPSTETEPMDLTKDSCFGKERSSSNCVDEMDDRFRLRPLTTGQPSCEESGILRHALLCPPQMPEHGGSDKGCPYRPAHYDASRTIHRLSHAANDRSPASLPSSPSIRRLGSSNGAALNSQLEAARQAGFESSNSAHKSEGYALMKHFTPELIPESLHQTTPHGMPVTQHGGQQPERITSPSYAFMLQGGGRIYVCNNDEKSASKRPQLYINSSGIVSSQGPRSTIRTVSPLSPTAAIDNPDIALSCIRKRTAIRSPQPAHSGSRHCSAELRSSPSGSMGSASSGHSAYYVQSKPAPVHEFSSSAMGPQLASPPPAHGMSRQLSPGSGPADSTRINFSPPSPDSQHSKVAAVPSSTPVTLPNFLLLPTTSASSRENIPEKIKPAVSEAMMNSKKGLECSDPLGGFSWHRPPQDDQYLVEQMGDVGEYSQDRFDNEKGWNRTSAKETDEDLEQDRTQWQQQFLQTLRQHREKQQQQLKQPDAISSHQSRDHVNPQPQEQEILPVFHRSSQRGRSSSVRSTRGIKRNTGGRGKDSFVTFTASGEVHTMLSSSQEQNNNWNTCTGDDARLHSSSSHEGMGNAQTAALRWQKSRGRPRGRPRGRGRGRPPALLFVPDSAQEENCSFSARSLPRESQASLSTKKVENWQIVRQQAPGSLGPRPTFPAHPQPALPAAPDMEGFKGESSVPPLRLKLATSQAEEAWHPVASKRMRFKFPSVSEMGKESELTEGGGVSL